MLHIYATMLHIYSTIQRLHQEPLPGEITLRRRQSANLSQQWVKNSKFHPLLRHLLFYYLIVLCSVNHLKSGKVYPRGTVLLAKVFKMTARSSAKSELTVNSFDFEVVEHDQIVSEKQMKIRKPLCI